MARLVLREPQVASEKEVVANERRYRVDDDVEGAANELLYKTAFARHPYGWPTIGWMEDIQGFTPEDCAAFYRTYYAPNNATVVVVGDVRERDLLLAIRDAYGGHPAHSRSRPRTSCPSRPSSTRATSTIRKPTATEKLLVAFKGPALGDADHATMTVLSEVLFGGRASRLYRTLVVERELATDAARVGVHVPRPGPLRVLGHGPRRAHHARAAAGARRGVRRASAPTSSTRTSSPAPRRGSSSGLCSSSRRCRGKAEQIGFFETVLGEPAHAFRPRRGLPSRDGGRPAPRRAALPRRRVRARSSASCPRSAAPPAEAAQ